MDEIKNCPFCGKEAMLFVEEYGGVAVKCTNFDCGMMTPLYRDNLSYSWGKEGKSCAVNRAIRKWNRRIE